MGFKKSIIVPFVAVFAIIFQKITGIEISQEFQNQIIGAVFDTGTVIIILYGIIKNFKKEDNPQ